MYKHTYTGIEEYQKSAVSLRSSSVNKIHIFRFGLNSPCRMRRRSLNDRIESIVIVRRVIHGPPGTIGIGETVLSSHHVPVSRLVLALGVARVTVVNVVSEGVLGMGIEGFHPSLHHRHGHRHHVSGTRRGWRRRGSGRWGRRRCHGCHRVG